LLLFNAGFLAAHHSLSLEGIALDQVAGYKNIPDVWPPGASHLEAQKNKGKNGNSESLLEDFYKNKPSDAKPCS
jgi:hypothetical protein